jgi:hypothetical protein
MAVPPVPQRGTEMKPADVIRGELRTLDSRISLIGQKISTIERNEEVLGRTLVALNERMKKLEAVGGAGTQAAGAPSGEVEALRKELDALRGEMVTRQEIKQLSYTLETINPLEYATLSQVRELIREELARK